MSTAQQKLIEKGQREPVAGLAQQGEYSLGLWDVHKKDLADCGFPEAQGTAMRDALAKVESALGSQKQNWADAHAKTRAEVIAIDNAKAFGNKLWMAVPLALRDSSVTGLSRADFVGLTDAGRVTSKIVAYLDRVRPLVAKLETQLKIFFKSESPVSILDNCRAALVAADQSQEISRTQAPDSTNVLNEQKGTLLQLIEDMNRVAAIAFHGRADIVGRFNKDILLRARRSKSGKADPVPEPPPAPSPNPKPV